jgi:hypothetical protein
MTFWYKATAGKEQVVIEKWEVIGTPDRESGILILCNKNKEASVTVHNKDLRARGFCATPKEAVVMAQYGIECALHEKEEQIRLLKAQSRSLAKFGFKLETEEGSLEEVSEEFNEESGLKYLPVMCKT